MPTLAAPRYVQDQIHWKSNLTATTDEIHLPQKTRQRIKGMNRLHLPDSEHWTGNQSHNTV